MKKRDLIIDLIEKKEFTKAIKIAARFPKIDKECPEIVKASSALLSSKFFVSIKQDPEEIIERGISVLIRHFSK